MPLRCLLFSSDEKMVQPILQVLTELGMEGEYCPQAVDAVERVTTQLFQIVITDWDDQPEGNFLLKTALDQKTSTRPLTLAIVGDDDTLPEALRAGANSVLVKPIDVKVVRETMNTARELLEAKRLPSTAKDGAGTAAPKSRAQNFAASLPAGARSATVGAAAAAPAKRETVKTAEQTFRKGEFLQTSGSVPGSQFETESEVKQSMERVVAADVDALSELEPMASSVAEQPAADLPAPDKALSSWASLQARLTQPKAQPAPGAPRRELMSYGELASNEDSSRPASQKVEKAPDKEAAESELFSYMEREKKEEAKPSGSANPQQNRLILVCTVALLCAIPIAMPQSRKTLAVIYRKAVVAGRNWLNPQPVQIKQVATQHDSFGLEGDEYKLPVAENIPDATTDPSQIRVVPVIDPTAKPTKNADSNTTEAAPDQNTESRDAPPAPVVDGNSKEQLATGAVSAAEPPAQNTVPPTVSVTPPGPNVAGMSPAAAPQQRPPAQISALQPSVLPSGPGSIPSSMRSQLGSMVPEASGAKPVEAAMSSIEPVNLPESAAWGLLEQPIDPIYPEAAKAAGQRGTVVLQVLIGRDGSVQDAKFMQGSLVFARSAIDAVKQWRFKPYLMNGRAVSVQSLITLNFKPPA